MPTDTVQARISMLIKAKMREDGLGVREAAKEARISAATFSRLGRGITTTLPDVATLEKLARWLKTTLEELLGSKATKHKGKGPEISTPEVVEVHLRADKNLNPETAKALSDMFKSLYNHATKKL